MIKGEDIISDGFLRTVRKGVAKVAQALQDFEGVGNVAVMGARIYPTYVTVVVSVQDASTKWVHNLLVTVSDMGQVTALHKLAEGYPSGYEAGRAHYIIKLNKYINDQGWTA